MRLFFAFDLPSDQARRLSELAPAPSPSVRPVAAERMHVTLRFVGDVTPDLLDRLIGGLNRAARLPSSRDRRVRVDGVGVFPGLRRARVLWAGLRIREGLVAMQGALESACVASGLPADGQEWHPHVTLARFSGAPPPDLGAWLDRYADLEMEPFDIDRVTLYDSVTTDAGQSYRPVASATV